MAVQKYDIRRPEAEGGGFEERFWSPVNCPVLTEGSGELACIIHRVEDVTEFVRLKHEGAELSRITEALRERTEQMGAEIFERARQIQDANEQLRLANTKLAQEREWSRALMESAPDAIVVTDANGTIVLVNSRTESLLGYARQELLGESVDMLLPERSRAAHGGHRRDYLRAPVLRPMGDDLELYARRKDGAELPVEVSLSPVNSAEGLQVACAIRDISDRKRVLTQLREARNEAEKANRAKSAFLATASHDLRQPVQALTLLNRVLERLVRDPDAADALAQQAIAIGGMSKLLNALLDISKLESGAIRPQLSSWNLASLFDEMRVEFKEVARSKGLDFTIEGNPPSVRSDPPLIGQVLRNLIANAIKYTRRGGVRVRAVKDGSIVHLEVRDSGIGMSADDLTRIYDEFYQIGVPANASREGYGLGLSIVSRILKLLDLKLDVRSEPGKGSVFTLALPAAPASTVPAGHPAARGGAPAESANAGRPPHILLVEDDPGVRNATRLLLRAEGYRVSVAASAGEAMALAKESDDLDLVVTDYHLSGDQNGMHVLSEVRKIRGSQIRAVVMSGDTSSAMRELGPTVDVRILSKPVESDRLIATMTELLLR
jgi:PAS domain S-box-containing protein